MAKSERFRAPDFTVHTPTLASTPTKKRWTKVGAAWNCKSPTGKLYISVVLDLMPTHGQLTLFRVEEPGSTESVPHLGDEDIPF